MNNTAERLHLPRLQAGGCSLCGAAKRWGIPIMKDPANPAGQAQCDNSTKGLRGAGLALNSSDIIYYVAQALVILR